MAVASLNDDAQAYPSFRRISGLWPISFFTRGAILPDETMEQ